MNDRPGGLAAGRHLWHKRRSAVEGRAGDLHALLDRALAAGVAPVEIESGLADLLMMAKRREYRDGLAAPPDGVSDHGLPPAD